VHRLIPLDGLPGCVEGLEPQARLNQSLEESMVLLYHVVEVLVVSQLDGWEQSLALLKSSDYWGINLVLTDIAHSWRCAVLALRVLRKNLFAAVASRLAVRQNSKVSRTCPLLGTATSLGL